MKSLNLKWKIALVGIIPLVFFTGLAGIEIFSSLNTYHDARDLESKVLLIDKTTPLVNETQKERGATAVFLKGGMSKEDLAARRASTKEQLQGFLDQLPISGLSSNDVASIEKQLSQFSELHQDVNSKNISVPDALKGYTEIISRLLKIELDVANNTSLAEISTLLRGLRIIEDAKEAGGKLRANMASVLAGDAPLTDLQFSNLVNLKAAVDANLYSSGLVQDVRSKQMIDGFSTSSEWHEVNATFKIILSKAEEGKYNRNPKDFFATISKALEKLEGLAFHQKDELKSAISQTKASAKKSLFVFSMSLFTTISLLFVFLVFTIRSTNKTLSNIAEKLAEGAEIVLKISGAIDESSLSLSESCTQQAASLQETVAALDEISVTAENNSASASASQEASTKSKTATTTGRGAVQDLLSAVRQIEESNERFADQLDKNYEQFSEITTLISEIGDKTKVINDIVFQTKLLSFNASVEAARANEHGKGFAVVAEEVGNLAAMSGASADEIATLLTNSITRVNSIVENTKGTVRDLVKIGKHNVENGTSKAQFCQQSLNEIFEQVSQVSALIQTIAQASNEQSRGVSEITTAMRELDLATQKNVSVAKSTSDFAIDLRTQSEGLNERVADLLDVIGSKKRGPNPESPQAI